MVTTLQTTFPFCTFLHQFQTSQEYDPIYRLAANFFSFNFCVKIRYFEHFIICFPVGYVILYYCSLTFFLYILILHTKYITFKYRVTCIVQTIGPNILGSRKWTVCICRNFLGRFLNFELWHLDTYYWDY